MVEPCEGALARGTRELRRLTLALGRELLLTDDHRVRTRSAGSARTSCARATPWPARRSSACPSRRAGWRRSCCGSSRTAPATAISGIDGKTIAWYSNSASDIADLAEDLARLGFPGGVSERRARGQHVLTRRSVELHARFRALGVPVGKKVYAWPERPFEWVFDLPAWQRAAFLSAFMSAEGSTPALASGT